MKTIIVKEMQSGGTATSSVRSIRKALYPRAIFGMAFMLGWFIASSALGQTTWQGGTGNWGLGTNWSAGVPNSTTNAFIDSDNGTNSVVNVNLFASVNDLTIDFGDTVNINNAQRLSIYGNLFNDGLLIVGSTGGNTYFQPVGTITFSGSGAVELTHSNAWLYDNSNSNAASDHLINGASHTIQGLGNIGFSSTLQITNQGLIDANVSGGTLNVTPNGAGMINTGTLRATNGGNLNLVGTSLGSSVIDNTGGTIEAGVGSTVTHNTSSRGIVGGQLSGSGTHLIGSSNARFDSLAVNAFVNIANSTRLDLLGTIVNNNLIRVNSTGGNTYLQPVGTTTLAGNGVVELTHSNAWLYDNSNSNAASDHLINSASHTIQGLGNIGFGNTMQITNQGLIDANVSGGTLNLTPNSDGMINTGTLRATNGGNLNLVGTSLGSSVIDNTGGTIEAGVGSTVTHNTSSRGIVGGQLTGSGTHLIGGSNARFDSLAVNAFVNIANTNRLDLLGTIVNNNLIRVNSTGGNTYLQPVGTTTLAGNGVVELTHSNAWLYDNSNSNAANDHLINSASHTIQGLGNIGFGNTLQITNQGLIDANVFGGTLNVTPNALGLDNSGTMRASNGGTLLLLGSNHGGTGTFEALDGSQLRVGASTVANNVSAGGVLTSGTWRAMDAGSGATLRILNNSTALINTIGAGAEVELSGAGSLFTVRSTNITFDSTLNNVQGSLILRDGRSMALSGGLNNSGNILIDGATTSLAVNGNYTQTGGSLFLVNHGTMNSFVGQASSGIIAGNGMINGDFTFDGTAILSPGASPGTLSFGNDLIWGAGGLVQFDLGFNAAATDFISVTGDLLKLGLGSFDFTFVNHGWVVGQTYDLIAFSNTNFSASDFNYTNGGGFMGTFGFSGGNTLQFTLNAIPEPSAGVFMSLAVLLTGLGRRRSRQTVKNV